MTLLPKLDVHCPMRLADLPSIVVELWMRTYKGTAVSFYIWIYWLGERLISEVWF